ncbi:type IX secretion system membrane protein PorP/SprF [Pedobacter sp. MC2016-14]|uniref:PorP/SprF family type IX secretion system membrane protein n=1 Tax=Pedobacter sp. MC2016-14 TaxID=2897327 RepID=UPI001E37574C|nr:type IX secretion system membrane protein PorP/SprF [Pedobacter sp. MC2016-14]MCD0486744.1 type IX secretion system membrane protein PorP/SprF [Pedobacter sp. MC2016-14]
MKAFNALCLFLSLTICSQAQETPRSTQYIFNSYLINPAVSGIDNYTDVKLGHRTQWRGLEGAPVTNYVSVHAPIGDDFVRSSVNSFAGNGYNPLSRSYVDQYMAAEPHHGIGFYGITDKAGRIRQTNAGASYAYHLGLSIDVNLALGVSAGFSSIGIDVANVKVDNTADPLLTAEYNNRIRPDVGAGFWLYSPRFFLGVSAKQIIGFSNAIENSQNVYRPYQKAAFYGTTGYKYFLDEDIAAVPSILISYWLNSPVALDANLKLAYQDKFWVGGSYRNNDSYSFLAGLNMGSLINLSYSYDVSSSALRSVNNGTHEIVLGILLNNRYEVRCSARQF